MAVSGCRIPSLSCCSPAPPRAGSAKVRRAAGLVARLGGQRPRPSSLLEAALNAAALRYQETQRPDPLLVDPYAGCFLSPPMSLNTMEERNSMPTRASLPCHYSLATKFIDDKLLSIMNKMDDLRQVVLLTDGMDTRPYRLSWPRSSVIYDISPDEVFRVASQRLTEAEAKIPRTCMIVHVPSESSDLMESLCKRGFNGNKSSIWVLQGFPLMTLTSLYNILLVVSSMATKGSIFLGELPGWLFWTECDSMEWSTASKRIEKLFMSHGFRVDMIDYDELARNLHMDTPSGDYETVLFVAEQLRFSDAQMERWREEFQRLEEEGDEEGFEEL